MVSCKGILVQSGEHPYKLTDIEVPCGKETDLVTCLDDFLDGDTKAIQIAVVCGWPNPWTGEEFSNRIHVTQPIEGTGFPSKKIINLTADTVNKLDTSDICVVVETKLGVEPSSALRESFLKIREVLLKICTLIAENNGNGLIIKNARTKVEDACSKIETAKLIPLDSFLSRDMAESISNLLNKGAGNFPTVRILIFMEEHAYAEFRKDKYSFIKQIHRVLYFEDIERTQKEEALKKELEALKKELTEKNRVINELKKMPIEADAMFEGLKAVLERSNRSEQIRQIIAENLFKLKDAYNMLHNKDFILDEHMGEKNILSDPEFWQDIWNGMFNSILNEDASIAIPDQVQPDIKAESLQQEDLIKSYGKDVQGIIKTVQNTIRANWESRPTITHDGGFDLER